ncbi:helix-turn-helix domain-containing protein [Actinomadura sp. 6N118]|uniref:helix-turn-helix domain-containing protein n=1 Tax=Actinomadura sp. 6N118 TaxID=3375151 RepID=UPI00378F95AF
MTLRRNRLVQRRRAVGYSQEQLADRLNIERTTVGRWERAETDPLPWIRPKLAQGLRISLDELDDILADIEAVEPERSERLNYALSNPANVDLVAVAYLRQRVQELTDNYDSTPSALLLASAGQCHGQVSYLREHTPSSRIRRDLWSVEAESATLMGQLVWDASQRSDHSTTLTFFDQAITAARQVQNVISEAHAQLRQCYVALYGMRDPRKGLTQAKRAARTSRGASHALTGLSLLHTAEAHAMLKDHAGCERALRSAESELNKVSADDPASERFSATQYGRLAGSCYLFLGVPERAQSYLEETAGRLHSWKKSRAIVLGNLSLAHMRQRRLDAAVIVLHEAIDIVEQNRGGGGMNIIFEAGRELRSGWHEPTVQDVHDRMLALMTNS